MPEWIPVKDRPPDCDRFLAISRFSDEIFIAERRKWGDRDWLVGGLQISMDIAFWMSLPEPPKK